MTKHNKHHHETNGKFPIETLTEADGYVLVYNDENAPQNPGSNPVVLARKVKGYVRPMFTEGVYYGAKYWSPTPR